MTPVRHERVEICLCEAGADTETGPGMDRRPTANDVLVCSHHAAGVAVTLTRSADNLIVESDWTPAILSQARDRTSRLGQDRTVTTTILLARGTIDEHMQSVQRTKADDLDILLGDGNSTAVMDGDLITPRAIVRTMVSE